MAAVFAPLRRLLLVQLALLPHRAAGLRLPQFSGAVEYSHASAQPVADDGTKVTVSRGRLFFLMTAFDVIDQEDVWAHFFAADKSRGGFMAFLHCQAYRACQHRVKRKDLFTIVPTVPSEYCANLISPMVALLNAALKYSKRGNPYDKFIFVSSTTLPVKPFWRLHRLLTENQEGMATIQSQLQPSCLLFKASQWSVLSYSHAARMVQAAKRTFNFREDLRAVLPENCTDECADEGWPLVAIFGAAELRKFPAKVPATLRLHDLTYQEWARKRPPAKADNATEADNASEAPVSDLMRRQSASGFPSADGDPAEPPDTLRTEDWAGIEEWRSSSATNHSARFLADGGRGPWGPKRYELITPSFLKTLGAARHLFVRKIGMEATFEGGLPLAEAWDKYIFHGPHLRA